MSLLKKGCTGEEVKFLQAALNFQMFDVPKPLVIDGIFGPKTKQRCLDFQEDAHLVTDAIVGDKTTAALGTCVQSEQHLLIRHAPIERATAMHAPPVHTPIKQIDAAKVGSPFAVPWPSQRRPNLPPIPFPFPALPKILPIRRTRTRERPYIEFLNRIALGAEGGLETNFSYVFPGRMSQTEREGETKFFAVANVTALWSRRVTKRLSLGLGVGFLHERALQREKESESTGYLFGQLKLKVFEHEGCYGNAYGLPLRIEGRWVNPLLAHKAFCTSVSFGPEFSFFHDRVSLGIGARGQICVGAHGDVKVTGILGPSASVLLGGRESRHRE